MTWGQKFVHHKNYERVPCSVTAHASTYIDRRLEYAFCVFCLALSVKCVYTQLKKYSIRPRFGFWPTDFDLLRVYQCPTLEGIITVRDDQRVWAKTNKPIVYNRSVGVNGSDLHWALLCVQWMLHYRWKFMLLSSLHVRDHPSFEDHTRKLDTENTNCFGYCYGHTKGISTVVVRICDPVPQESCKILVLSCCCPLLVTCCYDSPWVSWVVMTIFVFYNLFWRVWGDE